MKVLQKFTINVNKMGSLSNLTSIYLVAIKPPTTGDMVKMAEWI